MKKTAGAGVRESGAAKDTSGKPRILIADDEQSMREWMRLLFQRDGFDVLTAEDGIREGGVGALIADSVAALDLHVAPPRVRVLGTPIAYIPHGKPDAILAELGLDATGLEAEARALVAALRS